MTWTCQHCHTAQSVLGRVNGSPKEVVCPNCQAAYRITLEQIRPPVGAFQSLKPSRREVVKS